MKKVVAFLTLFLLAGISVFAQVGINTNNSPPDASAGLDVNFTNKGLLPPRMTFAQRNAIANPAEGLSVFCMNCNADATGCFSIYIGGQWLNLTGSCAVPVPPTEGSHVQTSSQIIWKWSAVPIATGYKWNYSNNYATAIDIAAAITRTEIGLTSGNSYARYVWAYNACGYSAPVTLNAQALTCGLSFQIIHTVGTVAPVSKTVTYGTVTTIPGETSKCWITSNLGADHQATAVNDATEASAGWYWQFNLKQGYMHDGGTRTPNTTWIASISENSDWTANNDPCSLLLGSAWRLPTLVEWVNVDAVGNWVNWNGPWSSGLLMHAAGDLGYSGGFLYDRGLVGNYWSSAQSDATSGWRLVFNSGGSYMDNGNKAFGFSARCVRDAPVSPTAPTVTTSSVTNFGNTSAAGGGNVTADGGATITARGVCWSTTTSPVATGSHTTDAGTTGSYTSSLTGLTAGTLYYVRAYGTNSAGTAYGNEVSFTTLSGTFTCGSNITINHVAGVVAPVTKTTTYGTVNDIPGEPAKCWITSNLGADHQATAVNDATEASAGWYWQFNLKQGYMHDGTTRTPNTAWIASINENSDWTANNDPCSLLLGSAWRLPTSAEWTNVDATGNWTNWNGPWSSTLQMHAAGVLSNTDGSLINRGSFGDYWSSSQLVATNGWFLGLGSGGSGMGQNFKAYGFSARCVRVL